MHTTDLVDGAIAADRLLVSVYGAAGVVDLVVPGDASGAQVSSEYAAAAALPFHPVLVTTDGEWLNGEPLAAAGVRTGAVLVALFPREHSRGWHGTHPTPTASDEDRTAGVASATAGHTLSFAISAGLAAFAGWYAAEQPASSPIAVTTSSVLLITAALGLVPIDRGAVGRLSVAPLFAAAAIFVVVWHPDPARPPAALGACALAAAVIAAIGRAVSPYAEEALRVWIIAGVAVFLLATGAIWVDLEAQVVWAALLLVAMLAARLVPGLAVGVPDQMLLDSERLMVSAWSAREQTPSPRDWIASSRESMDEVAERAARLMTAVSMMVLIVVAIAAPLLLSTAVADFDRIGALCLVGSAGAALLLVSRSYRHLSPRALLRAAGLVCQIVLLLHLAPSLSAVTRLQIAAVATLLGACVVVAAVATGRGWRSARWSHLAQLAEGLATAVALGSLVVASGLFAALMEL